MENLKTSLRSSARALSLTVISQQLVFQSLTGVLMVLAILIGFSFDSSLYLFSDIAMLISSCIFLFLLKGNLKEQNPQKGKVTLADFAKWFIIILGVNCFLSAIDTAFNLATGLSLTFPSESTTASPLLLLLTVGVFPAIAEELIFRGIVYRYLRRFGTVFAAFASSLIFGLIHLNVLQTLFAFCLGLVLCRAYEKSCR